MTLGRCSREVVRQLPAFIGNSEPQTFSKEDDERGPMAQVIRFFERQTLGSNPSPGYSDHYSETFEVADYPELTFTLDVYTNSNSGTIVTGTLQHTNDPQLNDSVWTGLATLTTTGTGFKIAGVTGIARFVRAKVSVSGGTYATLACRG